MRKTSSTSRRRPVRLLRQAEVTTPAPAKAAGARRPVLHALTMLAAAISLVVVVPGAANAGGLVDPSTFTPRPPAGAECREHGDSVLCRTRFTVDNGAVPVLDLPCGTVYEIITMPRNINTEYVDGLLLGRHVTSRVDGVWSLSPTSTGPTVRIGGGWNWRTVLTVPGDESTAQITTHGNQLMLGEGLARYANISGIFYPDGSYHGQLIVDVFETPQAQEALCKVLTG